MNFDISTERVGRWSVVRLAGDLDIATAGMLRRELDTQLQVDGKEVAVDLADLAFIDSSGLGVLLAGMKQSMTEGGNFALVAPGPQALRVFEAAGLLKFLPIYSSPEELPG